MTSRLMRSNIYLPIAARVAQVREESADIKTLVLEGVDAAHPLLASRPVRHVRRLWRRGVPPYHRHEPDPRPLRVHLPPRRPCHARPLRRGRRRCIGLRGPYGNAFPLDEWKGRDVVFVAGGIGLPALRSSIEYVLDNRGDYGPVTIVYGAKTPRELIYRARNRVVGRSAATRASSSPWTRAAKTPEWKGEVGLVPPRPREGRAFRRANAVALVCGPPIMIKFTHPGRLPGSASRPKLSTPPSRTA